MRRDVQEIFKATPHEKQVMMFSATLSKDIRPVCKKFMQDVSIANFPTLLKTSNFAAKNAKHLQGIFIIFLAILRFSDSGKSPFVRLQCYSIIVLIVTRQ